MKEKDVLQAIESGNVAKLQAAIQQGFSPNHMFSDGQSLLHHASSKDTPNSQRLVEFLFKKGANPKVKDKNGWTPTQNAIFTNNIPALNIYNRYNYISPKDIEFADEHGMGNLKPIQSTIKKERKIDEEVETLGLEEKIRKEALERERESERRKRHEESMSLHDIESRRREIDEENKRQRQNIINTLQNVPENVRQQFLQEFDARHPPLSAVPEQQAPQQIATPQIHSITQGTGSEPVIAPIAATQTRTSNVSTVSPEARRIFNARKAKEEEREAIETLGLEEKIRKEALERERESERRKRHEESMSLHDIESRRREIQEEIERAYKPQIPTGVQQQPAQQQIPPGLLRQMPVNVYNVAERGQNIALSPYALNAMLSEPQTQYVPIRRRRDITGNILQHFNPNQFDPFLYPEGEE